MKVIVSVVSIAISAIYIFSSTSNAHALRANTVDKNEVHEYSIEDSKKNVARLNLYSRSHNLDESDSRDSTFESSDDKGTLSESKGGVLVRELQPTEDEENSSSASGSESLSNSESASESMSDDEDENENESESESQNDIYEEGNVDSLIPVDRAGNADSSAEITLLDSQLTDPADILEPSDVGQEQVEADSESESEDESVSNSESVSEDEDEGDEEEDDLDSLIPVDRAGNIDTSAQITLFDSQLTNTADIVEPNNESEEENEPESTSEDESLSESFSEDESDSSDEGEIEEEETIDSSVQTDRAANLEESGHIQLLEALFTNTTDILEPSGEEDKENGVESRSEDENLSGSLSESGDESESSDEEEIEEEENVISFVEIVDGVNATNTSAQFDLLEFQNRGANISNIFETNEAPEENGLESASADESPSVSLSESEEESESIEEEGNEDAVVQVDGVGNRDDSVQQMNLFMFETVNTNMTANMSGTVETNESEEENGEESESEDEAESESFSEDESQSSDENGTVDSLVQVDGADEGGNLVQMNYLEPQSGAISMAAKGIVCSSLGIVMTGLLFFL